MNPFESLEYPAVNCFNELLEIEENLKLAVQYKERQDKKITELKSSLLTHKFFAFL